MATKTILKNTRRQAAVSVTGTGTAFISVHELAYGDQVVDLPNVSLTVTDICYDVQNTANIKRGPGFDEANVTATGNLIFTMSNGQNILNLSDTFGVVLNGDKNGNVVVNLGAAEGTCIVQFTKGEGYVDPDRQSLQVWQR